MAAAQSHEELILAALGWGLEDSPAFLVPGSLTIDWSQHSPAVEFKVRRNVDPEELTRALNQALNVYAARKR